MGMSAFKLTVLFCSITIYYLVESARILDNSKDSFGNWLRPEDEEASSQQSPPQSRRITAKSIFVAPVFNKCEEGHKQDQMGQCVKLVHVNVDAINKALTNALLQKLNSIYPVQNFETKEANKEEAPNGTERNAEIEEAIKKQESDDISGPLKLSIPFNSRNNSENITDEVDFFNGTASILKNRYMPATTTENIVTENTNELTTENINTEESTLPLSEITFSTNYPESYTFDNSNQSEFFTEILETTTISDSTVAPALSVTEIPSKIPPHHFYVNNLFNTASAGSSTTETVRQEEVTTVSNTVNQYTNDILKIPIKFPDSAENKRVDIISLKNNTDANVLKDTRNRTFPFSHLGNTGATNVNYNNFNKNENAKDSYNHEASNNNYVVSDNYNIVNISKDSDNSESSISSSSSVYVSTSESSLSSISNSKNDKYQKLPSTGRTRPKCDPANGYNDCILKFNVLSPDNTYSLNRNPMTSFIRFPGMYTKGTSLIRFPSGQKQPTDSADVVSFAENNSGTRFWESNRYPAHYWPSWDTSKPHFVRIWPDSSISTYNVASLNYNSRSQADNYA